MPPEITSKLPIAKDIVADENAVRSALTKGADPVHAKLLYDAYEKLGSDAHKITGNNQTDIFAEVVVADKARGVPRLIDMGRDHLETTGAVDQQVKGFDSKFREAVMAVILDEKWSKAGKDTADKTAVIDAKNIGELDNGAKLLDTFIAHMQDAFQTFGANGAKAYTDAVNRQLDKDYADGRLKTPFQISDLQANTCACDEAKPGENGSFYLSIKVAKDHDNPDGLKKWFERKF